MSLTSLSFLIFISIVTILYFVVPGRLQWFVLLTASIVFYLFAGPKYIVFVAVSTIVTFLCAGQIQKLHDGEDEKAASGTLDRSQVKELKKKVTAKCRKWLLLDLLVNLGLLAVLKYLNFALRGVSAILRAGGIQWEKQFALILPLGISFYTFMLVGYILDIFWRRYPAEKSFRRFALYTVYFPHITQGPISRYNKLSPQLDTVHPFDYDRVAKGFQLFLWGYFEKLVIADRLSVFANGVYDKWQVLTGVPLVVAIVFFSMQLYLDFQGCMDICRGISEVFGISLEPNFARPYFSKTMPEFWRRWHITLGAWFKDYLLYPVSMSSLCKSVNKWSRRKWGNAASRTVSTIIPAACVWLITGLWHGAAVQYVLWGVYHGFLIIGGAVMEVPFRKLGELLHINMKTWSFGLFRMARTFLLSAVGRIFFLSAGLRQAFILIGRTFNFRHPSLYMLWNKDLYDFGLNQRNFMLSLLLIAMIWGVGMVQEHGVVIRDWIAAQNLLFRWILYLSLIAAILVLGMYGEGYNAAAFVYQKF